MSIIIREFRRQAFRPRAFWSLLTALAAFTFLISGAQARTRAPAKPRVALRPIRKPALPDIPTVGRRLRALGYLRDPVEKDQGVYYEASRVLDSRTYILIRAFPKYAASRPPSPKLRKRRGTAGAPAPIRATGLQGLPAEIRYDGIRCEASSYSRDRFLRRDVREFQRFFTKVFGQAAPVALIQAMKRARSGKVSFKDPRFRSVRLRKLSASCNSKAGEDFRVNLYMK